MSPLQDIDFKTNNNKRLRVMLRQEQSGYFVHLQELITDGAYAGMYSDFSSPMHRFPDAKTAFEYAVKSLRLFLGYSNDDLKEANNPCNCELLGDSDQASVLNNLGLNITPTVNK
ncbi:hypothetical protein [Vibrio cholerae]|uniref:hypothetical protein n=1 Tax=Vibrio cholerae TaxID=666 RepID=UPI001667375C|nr:hypothetical protein [Vibrio cholerae]EGQ7703441.1 hypothetical protein [Vibrio cholerae]EJL6545602.1 hypothetical protein [Vibrio cholerae]EJL6845108.1 hypothetical protein [Vibrio cholerae]GFK34572.1 hypothetical protein VcPa01_02733 [Vibrio cholerae]GFK38116.1 hypothetical protein VcPa02_02724 [Vibrio cholerae]